MQFDIGQIAPLSDFQRTKLDIDNAHAPQLGHLVVEGLGHQPDLSVQALGQHDAEAELRELHRLARLGHLPVHAHAACHAGEEFRRDRTIHADQVFLLVVILGTQDLVDDIAKKKKQDEKRQRKQTKGPDAADDTSPADPGTRSSS